MTDLSSKITSQNYSEESKKGSLDLIARALAALTPEDYIRTLGYEPYPWQVEALNPPRRRDRLMIVAARQSGKTTVVAGRGQHKAKYTKNALSLVVCPAKDQSAELMQKIGVTIGEDQELEKTLVRDGVTLKEFGNASRIVALPGTERSVRGYSSPAMIVLDEASRVLDETYMALRPMMSRADAIADIVAITTAFGRRGWFYRAWSNPRSAWRKILVRIPWTLQGNRLVDAEPEDEFRARWAEQGVSAYYSTAHSKAQLEEDLQEMDPMTFRQEYECEFIDQGGGLFSYDDVLAAFATEQEEAIHMLSGEMEEAFPAASAFELEPMEVI